ncbi:hypothetical protein VN97_g2040, partial [Penicillium thymicola]
YIDSPCSVPANAFPENTSPTFGAQSEAKN